MVAGVSGIVDADALTLSMVRLGGNGLDIGTAAQAIVVGVAVNTLTKAVMAVSIGGWRLGLRREPGGAPSGPCCGIGPAPD